MLSEQFKQTWLSNVKGDLLSGLLIALAMIPQSIAFALMCGLDPMVGLHASFCIAVVIAIFGGRPAMISGATAATALVLITLVKNHGVEYMYAATLLMGVIQVVFGKLKLGDLMNFVPHPVVLGFLNALAVLIFMSQLRTFEGASMAVYIMAAATLAIVYLLPLITKAVPSGLVALAVMTIYTVITGHGGERIKTVGDMGHLTAFVPSFHFPQIPFTVETLMIILPYAFALAMVGIVEVLVTAVILDEQTDTPSDKNMECTGQGFANLVSGFFGGMGGCASAGLSMVNIKSGGRGRLSTLASGVFLFLLIFFFSDAVKMMPMPALTGIMMMVAISTFEWHTFKEIKKMSKACVISLVTTMAVIIFSHDLALGVYVGVVMSAIVFAWNKNKIRAEESIVERDGGTHHYFKVHGALFFASSTQFSALFQPNTATENVIVDLTDSQVWDYSAATALAKLKKKYEKNGKTFSLLGLNEESKLLIYKADQSFLIH
jgi:SulP family sulfate permease